MRKAVLVLILSLSLVFLALKPADAGISLGKGTITLSAGQATEVCDIWIYGGQEGGTYQLSTTGDLEAITTSIIPNNFELDAVDCPEEENARRNCISQACLSGEGSSCKIICVKFTAPMLIEWDPQRVTYNGGILNTIKIGAASVKETFAFTVHVNPMDMKPLVGTAVVVIIVIVILLFLFLRKFRR
jgi:hypothetical protein